jgi:DNA-directed RNA polymerase subunit RPC12/RpoP
MFEEDEEETYTCRECGKELDDDDKYCSQECYNEYWADLED